MLTIDVNRYEYEPETGRLLLSWNIPLGEDVVLTRNRLEFRFSPILEHITDVEVFDIFCGCLLPHFGLRSPKLAVKGLPRVPLARHDFWRGYLQELDIKTEIEFDAPLAEAPVRYTNSPIAPSPHRVGLYFGGGVESLALLRKIKHTKPYLMTVDGPAWMNSDYDRSSIKGRIQEALGQRYDLEYLRVWTDARTLCPYGDEYVNQYLTGSLFYYLLLPLMRRYSVGVCYLAAELEYSLTELPHDMSIHPRFVHKVSKEPDPPLLSPFNAISKIDLLDDLYRGDPDLCSYLYSCLQNSENRWCGECGKCRRISVFCEAIGIPRALIGMQDGIGSEPETEKSRALYWQSVNRYLERKHGIPPESETPPAPVTQRSFWRWPRLRRSA